MPARQVGRQKKGPGFSRRGESLQFRSAIATRMQLSTALVALNIQYRTKDHNYRLAHRRSTTRVTSGKQLPRVVGDNCVEPAIRCPRNPAGRIDGPNRDRHVAPGGLSHQVPAHQTFVYRQMIGSELPRDVDKMLFLSEQPHDLRCEKRRGSNAGQNCSGLRNDSETKASDDHLS